MKDIDEFSFLLGLFAADGNLDKMRVRFFCSEEEIEFFQDKIVPMMEKVFHYKATVRHDIKRNYVISINSKKVENNFRKIFDYKGKKTRNIELPKCKFNEKSFIVGLICGDGSINIMKNNSKRYYYPRLSYVSASKILINFFCEFLEKNKISYYLYERPKKIYQLNVKGNELKKLLKLIFLINPVQKSKLKVVERFGSLLPKTTYGERLKMLKCADSLMVRTSR